MKSDRLFKYTTIFIFLAWLLIFGVLPFLLILLVSLLSNDPNTTLTFHFTLSHYATIFQFDFLRIFIKSFSIAATCTILCLIIAYPFAYFLANVNLRYKHLLLVFLILPFWTSSIVRSYAIITLIKSRGLLNTILLKLGIIHVPLQLLFTNTAVLIGLVYNLLPFMILPLFANIERLETHYIEVAKDLGASGFTVFRRIIIPLTMPGIIAGVILVFFPAMTVFYIPDLLGGAKSMLLGNLIENQFLTSQNWPEGAALSIVLTVLMMLMLWLYWAKSEDGKRSDFI